MITVFGFTVFVLREKYFKLSYTLHLTNLRMRKNIDKNDVVELFRSTDCVFAYAVRSSYYAILLR